MRLRPVRAAPWLSIFVVLVFLVSGTASVAAASISAAATLPLSAPAGNAASPAAATPHAFPTPIQHVIVVLLENEEATSVFGVAPYETHLAYQYSYANKYYATTHPSAPNYLSLTSGSYFTQAGSDSYHVYNSTNIGDLVQGAGLSWAAYDENMPQPCDLNDTYPYALKHNPMPFYADIVDRRQTHCKAFDLGTAAWNASVAADTVPNYVFYTPNMIDDGHDTSVSVADNWLKGWLPPLLNDSFFASSVFFIVYDEGSTLNGYNGTSGGQVYMAAVSPYSHSGYWAQKDYSHWNLLTTTEWLLGLGNCGHNDNPSTFPPMKDLFTFPGGGALTATASGSPLSGIAPLPVSFTSSATGGTTPYTYTWAFGDGSAVSTAQNPSHTYSTAGTYTARLWVNDSASHSATKTVNITVTAPVALSATAGASPTSGTAPLAVTFNGSASGGSAPYTFAWVYGDGNVGSSRNPSHTYTLSGTHTAKLFVNDSASHSATSTVAITVSAPVSLTASAGASPTTGTAPLAVSFTGSAAGGTSPYTYSWVFGDASTSPSQNPSHTYSAAGTYTASLFVNDSASHSATSTVTITVTPLVALTATAGATPLSGTAPLSVSFSGSASGGTSPYTYAWVFGDATTSSSQNPTHSYATAGTYVAHLFVNDSASRRARATVTVTVTPATASLSAAIVASVQTGAVPLPVAFSGFASGGVSPYTYAWRFGDGGASAQQNPSHTFAATGTFTTELWVNDSGGNSATTSTVITVTATGPAPVAVQVSVSPTAITLGQSANFTAVASGGTGDYDYTWSSLPTGCASSNVAILLCTPTATGSSTVQVTVTDSASHSASAAVTLTVSLPSHPGASNGGGVGLLGSTLGISNLYWLVIVAAIAAVAGVAVALSRRRRPPVAPGVWHTPPLEPVDGYGPPAGPHPGYGNPPPPSY